MPPLSAAPCPRRRHLRPEVLAPSGLCCPGHPRLPTSSASPGALRALSQHPPVMGAVLDIHRVILAALLTFRTFPAALSRIAAFTTPGTRHVPLSSFRAGTGHRVAVSTLGIAHCPLESAPCGTTFFDASSVRSRYGPPGCSPPGLTRPPRPEGRAASQGFYFRAFRSPGHPACLPDITTAPN